MYLYRLTDWQKNVTGLGLRGKKKPKLEVSSRSIRRLAMRAGVTRIQNHIMSHFKLYVKLYLENIVKDAIIFANYGGRRRVTCSHIVMAVRRNTHQGLGQNFYHLDLSYVPHTSRLCIDCSSTSMLNLSLHFSTSRLK